MNAAFAGRLYVVPRPESTSSASAAASGNGSTKATRGAQDSTASGPISRNRVAGATSRLSASPPATLPTGCAASTSPTAAGRPWT